MASKQHDPFADFRVQLALGSPLREVLGAILIGFWHVLFYTDYPISDRSFELYQYMQTVILHTNQVDGIFLTHSHTRSPRNQQF